MSSALTVAVLLLGVAAPAPAPGQARDTLVVDLAEAERRALESSPLLRGATGQVDLARAQSVRASHARYLPEFNLRNVWGPIPRQRGEFTESGVLVSPDTALGVSDLSWFTQVNLEVLQPIYGFGKIGARVDAAERALEASEAGLEGARAEALFLVRQLYWGVVLGGELERVVEDVLENAAEAEEKLLEQYDEGSATQNDLFKFRLFKYEINSRAREVADVTDKALAGLRAAMGVDAGVSIGVETTTLEPVDVSLDSLDTYLEAARANRSELHALHSGIAARRSLARAASRDFWPTLYVAGGLSINRAPDRFDPRNPFWQNQTNYSRGAVLLGFDWNLNFLKHRDEARVERYEAALLEAQVDGLAAKVDQEVRGAYLTAQRAQADLEEGRAALRASDNWLRAELQTYDIGIGEIKDVIEAFQANVQMNTEQLRNIAEFNMAIAEMSRRVGEEVAPAGEG